MTPHAPEQPYSTDSAMADPADFLATDALLTASGKQLQNSQPVRIMSQMLLFRSAPRMHHTPALDSDSPETPRPWVDSLHTFE